MNKDNLYILIPYLLLIIIATVFMKTKINSCNKPETVTLQRDSVSQKYIDSIKVLIQKVKRIEEIQDSALMINESGIIANRTYFIKVMNDFVKFQKVKRELPLNEQWKTYLREIGNE